MNRTTPHLEFSRNRAGLRSRSATVMLPTLLACSLLFATRYAGDFEELGASSRAVGMGSAFVAAGADPAALYYNPAVTAMMTGRNVMLMHAENFGGIVRSDFGTVLFPLANAGLGAGILHNGVSGIKLTRLLRPDLPIGVEFPDTNEQGEVVTKVNLPVVTETVSAADWIGYFNYARRVGGNLHVGGNAKLIYRTTGVSTCLGMGLDIGALLVIAQGFNVGLQVRNVTTSPLFWNTGTTEAMDPRATLGLSKTFALGRDHRLQMGIQAEGNLEGLSIEESAGAEYSYRDMVFGRLGLHRGNFTFGLGGAYKRFFLDYGYETAAYADSRELPPTQRLSGGIRF